MLSPLLSVSLPCPLPPIPNAPWFSSETLALYKSLTYLLTYLLIFLLLLFFLLGRPLHKCPIGSVVSNGIGMKFGRNIPQVNMHGLTETEWDFRFDAWECCHLVNENEASVEIIMWQHTASTFELFSHIHTVTCGAVCHKRWVDRKFQFSYRQLQISYKKFSVKSLKCTKDFNIEFSHSTCRKMHTGLCIQIVDLS